MERKRNIQPMTEARRAAARLRHAASEIALLPHEIERRSRSRHVFDSPQSSEAVRLVDLSTHGCSLGFATATELRPGQFIRLAFPGQDEPMRAIVRWADERRIGVEFTRGLAGSAIDDILREDQNLMVELL